MIDASTRVYCILANPVRHSFSPAMQNAAFAAEGIDAAYVAFEVEDIAKAVESIRVLGIDGASVTIPYKVSVMQYVDGLEDIADHIGSVNTLINRDGKIVGTNTDAYGFYRALSEKISVDGKTVAVFGSGGASRAVCFALFHYAKPRKIILFVRDDDRAESERLRSHLLTKLGLDEPQVQACLLKDWKTYGGECDILVNTTPLGMHPNESVSVLDEPEMPSGKVVMDLVYNPSETKFLKSALAKGCTAIYGIDMLLYQGVRQFELWTGRQAPVDVMKQALLSKIGK